MAQVELLFKNGKIVTAGKIIDGFVAVDKEKIVAVGEGDTAPQALKTIDLKGRTLMPGVVDPEVHFGSHRWVGDEFDSETRGAAAYGITTWGFMQPSANMGQPYKAEKPKRKCRSMPTRSVCSKSWARRARWSIFFSRRRS